MSEPRQKMMRHLSDDDKPREKALDRGIGVLTDTELLAILLRTGIKGQNVIEVSRDILAMYDHSLARLSRATADELTRLVPGIGPAKAITLIAALELGLRCRGALAREYETQTVIDSSAKLYGLMREKLERVCHEEFWVVMLNRRLGVESVKPISSGGTASTVVDIKILMKKVLDCQASNIALIHNHPSGNLKPSVQDDELTKRICRAAQLFDIRVVDHVIITPSGYYSYNDEGRMPAI